MICIHVCFSSLISSCAYTIYTCGIAFVFLLLHVLCSLLTKHYLKSLVFKHLSSTLHFDNFMNHNG